MRVFLIWPEKGKSPELADLMSQFSTHGHQLVYFVGHPHSESDVPADTIFHSYIDATNNSGAKKFIHTQFDPPGAELIQALYKLESIVLSMMNRIFDELCVDERRTIYYEMVTYWYGVLNQCKPDIIIFPTMPHFVYDYILYELAAILKIKTIAFDDTRIPGRLLYFTDFWKGSENLSKEIENLKGINFSINDLSQDIREYYIPRSSTKFSSTPSYIEDQKKKFSSLHWLLHEKKIRASIKDGSFLIKAPRYLWKNFKEKGGGLVTKPLQKLMSKFRDNLKKEYLSLQSEPDFNKKFIYVPLQSQPERTMSPQGDMFANQILVLSILSAALPEGWIIYTKEHPIQWFRFGVNFSSSRYRGYYKQIAKIKNVQIIPLSTNTYPLIDKSQAVVTITGSAAWEAVLRSKPAVIFGQVWYKDCPGIFKVEDVPSCKKIFKLIEEGFKVDQQGIINYLKAFDNATIQGFIASTAGKASKLTKRQSMENITRFLLTEMS